MGNDIFYILKWWIYLLGIGLLFYPFTGVIFKRFFDRGYIFSKAIGLAAISYASLVLGVVHILPFSRLSLFAIILLPVVVNLYFIRKRKYKVNTSDVVRIVLLETLFLGCILFWSYIKSFQPDIHGLEKFMDFGFMNSILRSTYFPPVDMWYPPFSINYYYFGHLVTAVLIKLTNIPGAVAYNIMLATIFGFTVLSAFSIVGTLIFTVLKHKRASILGGLLGGILTALGGNLHTIYTFFAPYVPAENPVPFWQLKFLPQLFPNSYWYPNATRFIPFTIHEFPSYSFVVSDLHGHVLDIPFVLLTIGLILSVFLVNKITIRITILISFMLAVMYMTNAWDGIIYFLLLLLTILLMKSGILAMKKSKIKTPWYKKYSLAMIRNKKQYGLQCLKYIFIAGIGYSIFSLPFNLGFKPFVSGIGVICPPDFLTTIGKIGPLIFEPNHCQRTPFWMILILYGFFYFFVVALVLKVVRVSKNPPGVIFILLLILVSTILIATPEFIYAKDIYPAHYRANTMFKLGYQAFMMLSMVSAFSITYLLHKGRRIIWTPIIFILLGFVLMYPYFAVNSYFGELKNRSNLDGLSYLKSLYPDDYEAIAWIQENIKNQPVILESQGDSYTDHGRISSNTGLPTPLGWTVHEWLWRGDYSFPQARLEDITDLYEGDLATTVKLIKKYNISYIYVGTLEKTKYQNLNEEKFKKIGKVVYQKGDVKIYQLN